jgi:hypothetical protein
MFPVEWLTYAGSTAGVTPSLLNWKGEAAETVGAMRKSRRADTRLTPSAPSQMRRD